jgi:cell division protease FtsH
MNDEKQSSPPQSESFLNWRYLFWVVLLIIFLMYGLGTANRQTGVKEISYTEFKQALHHGQVAEVTFSGQHILGTYTEDYINSQAGDEKKKAKEFATIKPPFDDQELPKLLEQQDVIVRAESQDISLWAQALVGILPWILILGLFFYASYRMQQRMMGGGGRGGPFGFGKAPVKRFREEGVGVTFDDVAGVENAKHDLREIVDYLREPGRFKKVGAKIPRGILLMGPPGTGKTLLARAVAGEAGVPFYSISGSDFIEMFVGVGAARVRDMFKAAKEDAPSILFIDEIDSVGRARGTGLGGGHDEREQTLNQILGEMDGFSPHENVVVLAATNRPDVLIRPYFDLDALTGK